MFDALVIGGGVMGATTALHLARGGMKVAVIERGALGMGASGVNAGTLSLQIKRASLVPYAIKGIERWRSARERLGTDVHCHRTGGLTLAFTDAEAEVLRARMTERKAAGVNLEFVTPARAREIEPGLSANPVLASYCPEDGYASSTLTGRAYRQALLAAGVEIHEGAPVAAIERDHGYRVITPKGTFSGKRIVLAAGAWLAPLGAMLGLELPISVRINTVSVTARMPMVIHTVIGHATGLLTLKQSDNGTMLIGGGWQGRGNPPLGPVEVVPDNVISNLRLAQHAVPALARARVVRTWLGLEANVPDMMPLVGALPGLPDAFVIGAVRGGYTIGPYMGELLATRILGREPEMPLFDPARFNALTPQRKTA